MLRVYSYQQPSIYNAGAQGRSPHAQGIIPMGTPVPPACARLHGPRLAATTPPGAVLAAHCARAARRPSPPGGKHASHRAQGATEFFGRPPARHPVSHCTAHAPTHAAVSHEQYAPIQYHPAMQQYRMNSTHPSSTTHPPVQRYFMSSNSPSGGTNETTFSALKRPRLTQGWKVTSWRGEVGRGGRAM